MFPDSVVQDRSQDREDRTTVINWQSATVSGSGVTYDTSDMTDDDVTVMIANNTQTTAVVTVPQFNVSYNVCIEAFDDCGNPSGTPRCTTVIIEAESMYIVFLCIHGMFCCCYTYFLFAAPIIPTFTTELMCSDLHTVDLQLMVQQAAVMWTVVSI